MECSVESVVMESGGQRRGPIDGFAALRSETHRIGEETNISVGTELPEKTFNEQKRELTGIPVQKGRGDRKGGRRGLQN